MDRPVSHGNQPGSTPHSVHNDRVRPYLLALPRELRDNIYELTLHDPPSRRLVETVRNKDGEETGRMILTPSHPPTATLFLVNRQISAEYKERCSKIMKDLPQHLDIIYGFPDPDTHPRFNKVDRLGLDLTESVKTCTLNISIGPEWAERSDQKIEEDFIRRCQLEFTMMCDQHFPSQGMQNAKFTLLAYSRLGWDTDINQTRSDTRDRRMILRQRATRLQTTLWKTLLSQGSHQILSVGVEVDIILIYEDEHTMWTHTRRFQALDL